MHWRLPRWFSGKESACQYRRHKRCWFNPWVGKIPWSRKWQPTSVVLPGKFHGQRSLEGYSSWCCKELDMTEWLSTDVSALEIPVSWYLKKRKNERQTLKTLFRRLMSELLQVTTISISRQPLDWLKHSPLKQNIIKCISTC